MPTLVDLYVDEWWRWSRYAVRDGYISPAPGVSLTRYDPWQSFRASQHPTKTKPERGKRATEPPYLTLVNLLASLEFSTPDAEGDPDALTESGKQRIAEWCATHGLLGVLPQRTQSAVVEAVTDRQRGGLKQRRYVRTGADWTTVTARVRAEGQEPNTAAVQRPITYAEEPHAVVQVPTKRGWKWEAQPLDRAWARFFPSATERQRTEFQYPAPLTDGFWRSYAEPVADFLDASRQLERALWLFKSDDEDAEREREIRKGLQLLNDLASTVSPSLVVEEEGLVRRWRSPSLLATFAMMALENLTTQRVLVCSADGCNNLFVTDAYQAEYCSPRCRLRMQKRNYRARKVEREKEEER